MAKRLASGKLRPRQAYEISYALVSAVAGRLRGFIARLTAEMWNLEYRFQAVVKAGPAGHLREPELFLDELFAARHGFMVARTQAAMSREVFARMHKIKAFGRGRGQKRIGDAVDQFDHLRAMADGEKENLQGTIEFYQARTNTKVTVAAERLAVIAAITLPGHGGVVHSRHERHRQRRNPARRTRGRGDRHGRHVGGPAGLGQTAGLVVTSRHHPVGPI